VTRTVWTPVAQGNEISIAKDLLVKPLRNGHVPTDEHIIKSLGYMVVRLRKKLRPEFAHLSGQELRQLAEQQGRDSFSMEVRENILGYSGDTPVEDGAKWDNTKILIHEATFLDSGEPVKTRDYGNKHSTLFLFPLLARRHRPGHQGPM
jgi:ribonuclease Z